MNNPDFNFGSYDVRVRKLIVQETGTYNAMYQRPYQIDPQEFKIRDVINRVASMRNGVQPTALNSVASSLMAPAAVITPGVSDINIPNGWGQRRFRFLMEVHTTSVTGSLSIYWIQGFTDYNSASIQGHLNPDMRFFMNSMIRLGRMMEPGPTGMQYRDKVIESVQLINSNMIGNGNNVWRLRPCDIYSGIQSAHYSQANRGSVYDTRHVGIGDSRSFASSRNNNITTHYLGNFIQAYQGATELAAVGQGNMNIMNRAQSDAYMLETEPEVSPFLRALAQIRQVPQALDFSLKELVCIDKTMPAPVYNRIEPSHYGVLNTAAQVEYWRASDRETVVATTLANAIPSLMMEHFIGRMKFTATNMLPGPRRCTIVPAKIWSITNADMTTESNVMLQRMDQEVFRDISYNNEDPYDIEMTVDVFGETRIRVRLQQPHYAEFTIPSFGDGLLAPTYTTIEGHYDTLTNEMQNITAAVREVMVAPEAPSTTVRGAQYY